MLISAVILFIILVYLYNRITLKSGFSSEVTELFSGSREIGDRKFHADQIKDLPVPVQKYFSNVLKEGQPYISYVRLKHDGVFRTAPDSGYVKINGEQYYTLSSPGFVWKGETAIFTARDRYIDKKGSLVVQLFSSLRIVNASGERYNHSELLRWLGESVWFPTNLLPSPELRWSAVDDTRARIDFTCNGIDLYYIVDFNDNGEIVRLQTERYMDGDRLETWAGTCSGYREFFGIKIPSVIEAAWIIDGVEKPYARFNLKEIEYNIPEQYS